MVAAVVAAPLFVIACDRATPPSPDDDDHAAPAHSAHGASADVRSVPLPDAVLPRVQHAFDDAEKIRKLLARDTTDGVKDPANAIAEALEGTSRETSTSAPSLSALMKDAAAHARSLTSAADVTAARAHFSELNRALFVLAAGDARLQAGWHAFQCPMAKGFPNWFQREATIENPYMGQRMPTCGSPVSFDVVRPPSEMKEASGEVAYWTCPMHPSVKQPSSGQCPICGMDLTPVTQQELKSGVVLVDDVRRQKIGVRTAPARKGPLEDELRAVGKVAYDQSRLFDVTLKLGGFVEKLFVDKPGQCVAAGAPLFLVYSPELYAAQLEYLAAKRHGDGEHVSALLGAARTRLELWGVAPDDLAEIERSGEARRALPIRATRAGYVVEKNVVEGARVDAGERVLRLAALDAVWIEADVYEDVLPQVHVGDAATVSLPYLQGRSVEGKVSFIYPYLDPGTRTGRVRVEIKNPDLDLKPDMFAEVAFKKPSESVLQIDKSAVIFTGTRRLVFIDLGEGRLKPVEVTLGRSSRDAYEVLAGLREGDRVVISGNFLVAAESRLKSAQSYWAPPDASSSAASAHAGPRHE
jgi:Cu(I)/Ag(I) efflux system membrane fusion protein